MRLTAWLVAAMAVAGASGCRSPEVGPKIVKAPPRPVHVLDAPSTDADPARSSEARTVGRAPVDLRRVDWSSVAVSGSFCDIPGLVRLRSANAMAVSTTHGTVHVVSFGEPTYGDLVGDSQDEVAMPLGCDNNGGTGSGQIATAFAIFARRGRDLVLLGTLTSQKNPDDVFVTSLTAVRFGRGALTVTELWYRSTDASCCPSGVARTHWTLRDGRLIPGPPQTIR